MTIGLYLSLLNPFSVVWDFIRAIWDEVTLHIKGENTCGKKLPAELWEALKDAPRCVSNSMKFSIALVRMLRALEAWQIDSQDVNEGLEILLRKIRVRPDLPQYWREQKDREIDRDFQRWLSGILAQANARSALTEAEK